ncbi:hypothetical protein NW752_007601 [Fusarium irregulare]|uniref:Heterokaryon incompatibility domain-containing protein n=1 Tax=Fusarium irregulare TaxID=2494466 RepID=A0A9W8PIU6_9HYPO|nr:hypothetical protein NW766_010103 [Fusarium irregulare]KAJ4013304.1 hypothetical protein NW752_007601 [Fusarium irregulare]
MVTEEKPDVHIVAKVDRRKLDLIQSHIASDLPRSKSDFLLVYTTKPVEEIFKFGLRGSDIQDIRPEPDKIEPASPEDWGFTSTTSDGICKYCQLVLHPDAPSLVQHHPNLQQLVNWSDTCICCKWLNMSIKNGSPSLVARYEEEDLALRDDNSTSCPLTVELIQHEKFTRAFCWVGDRDLYRNCGAALTITTPARLGDLTSRRFWIHPDEFDESNPRQRQDLIKNWMNECDDHDICKASLPNTRTAALPTRVLDLTGSSDLPMSGDDIVVKLRETNEDEVGTYTTLSYCWGSDSKQNFMTTHATLDEYKKRIPFFSLPLTHREAILTTLHLGIRYIWIDSLCIIQDSHEDWQTESDKMGSVYSNAHLTLAATSSSSPDEGLHTPFTGARTVDIHGEPTYIRFESHLTIDASYEPLNTRGWTLQEAVLLSRLVCFGKEQWLWKCPSRYATEDGLIDGPRYIDNGLPQWPALTHEGPGEDGKNYLRHWYHLITNYSKRELTYETDKQNAIAGLVDMFQKQTGFTYLAGLWQEDLAAGLTWEATKKGVIRQNSDTPSWSWLSVKGPIKGLDYKTPTTPMIELVDVYRASNISLTVKGKVLRAALGQRSVTQESRHYIVAEPNSIDILGEAFLDTRFPDDIDMWEITCLFVFQMAGDKEYFVLVLTGDAKKYQRLGVGVVWEKSKSYEDPEIGSDVLERARESIVTLV